MSRITIFQIRRLLGTNYRKVEILAGCKEDANKIDLTLGHHGITRREPQIGDNGVFSDRR
jgi:hypothetical protein